MYTSVFTQNTLPYSLARTLCASNATAPSFSRMMSYWYPELFK